MIGVEWHIFFYEKGILLEYPTTRFLNTCTGDVKMWDKIMLISNVLLCNETFAAWKIDHVNVGLHIIDFSMKFWNSWKASNIKQTKTKTKIKAEQDWTHKQLANSAKA